MSARQSLALCLLLFFLTGCISTAVTGASMAYDHYDLRNSASNKILSIQAANALYRDPLIREHSHIKAFSVEYVLLLSGYADTLQIRSRAITIVKKISGIKQIINAINIGSPPSFSQQATDTWITTKIRTRLLFAKEINAPKIKVITENGIVYLIGLVTPEQADIAISIAKNTVAVKRVVQVFQYMYITYGKRK